ncbi:MAG TPA: hypothetical protein VH255_06615 [Verrucomicrobiae bacterium]|nr:hypothetical protein [Verrucomicrobiae bacterium]
MSASHFLAEADIEGAHDEEAHYDPDENQIVHEVTMPRQAGTG